MVRDSCLSSAASASSLTRRRGCAGQRGAGGRAGGSAVGRLVHDDRTAVTAQVERRASRPFHFGTLNEFAGLLLRLSTSRHQRTITLIIDSVPMDKIVDHKIVLSATEDLPMSSLCSCEVRTAVGAAVASTS